MTSQTFQIGNEVENIGPDVIGNTFEPEKFTIRMLWQKNGEIYYSTEHMPWYPASSLRLVEGLKVGDWGERDGVKFQISDVRVGANETLILDGASGLWHSSAFVRRAAPKLQIGDHVCVMGPSCKGKTDHIGEVFTINEMSADTCSGRGQHRYPAKSLRKLTPDEIKQHTGKANTFTVKFKCDTSEFDKCLDKLANTTWKFQVDERLSAIEKRLDAQRDRADGIQYRIDELKRDALTGEKLAHAFCKVNCGCSNESY